MARCAPDVRSLAIQQLINADGGADAIKRLARAVLEAGDDLGLNIAVREAAKPNWKKAMVQLRSAGLLSRPTTHMKNILGNMAVSIGAVPERYLAAGFSKAFHGGSIDFGEANALAVGWLQGQQEAFKMIALGSKAAEDPAIADLYKLNRPAEMEFTNHLVPEAFGVSSDGSAFGKGLSYAMMAADLPHKALQVEDDFFKSVAYRQELNATAYRMAKGEGLEGEAFAARFNDLKNNPPDHLQMAAFDFAKYQTFTNDLGKLGQQFSGVLNADHPGSYLLKFIIPYYKTPVNILKYTFERTPLAVFSKSIRADIRAGGARAAQAEARIALGSSVMAMGGMMALNGTVSGQGPSNPNQRKIKMQTGWQPYSIKLGDRWVSYNGLEPWGGLLGLAADMGELSLGLNDEDREAATVAGVMAIAQNLGSKTYLSGMFDFMAAIDDGNFKQTPEGWLIGQSQTFIPFSSSIRGATRASDPVLRDTKTELEGTEGFAQRFINELRAKIPGQSETLPARLDLWGQEINVSSGFGPLYDFASPFASRIENPDPVDQAILDNQVSVSWPQRSVNGVKLSPEQYHDYSKRAGELAKERLDGMIGNDAFKRMSTGPDGLQAEIIKRVINDAREMAKSELIAKDADFRNTVLKKKLEKVNALTGR